MCHIVDCSHSYNINMIEILKISIQYDKLSPPHCVAGHQYYVHNFTHLTITLSGSSCTSKNLKIVHCVE